MFPGEVLALVGANGAGKSTLMKLLSGELKPTQGGVALDGHPMAGYGALGLARRRAVLPQNTQAAHGLTVEETLALGRVPHFGVSRAGEDQKSVEEALKITGLDSWRNRQLGSLSGGEAQRVHFARGLVQLGGVSGSCYYFLDEPTSALDLAHQIEVLSQVVKLAERGVGIVLVVHDLNLAARFAHKLAVLREGRLEAWGTPKDVLEESLVLRAFSTRAAIVPHPILGHPLVLPLESLLPA